MFTTLKNLCTDGINTKYNELLEEIKTEEGLKAVSSRYNKTYIKNPQQKLTKFLNSKKEKELKALLEKVASIENAEDFNEDFVITLEWTKSHTWGYNPKVYTNTGYEHKGISGCGYDKQSTATAYALNSNLSILKLLYQKKEEELNKILSEPDLMIFAPDFKNGLNRSKLGYGSGYSILPYFEGGVGIGSHEHILNNLGLILEHISNTKYTDVYLIKKQI